MDDQKSISSPSAWSRFRAALWALRVVVLADGAWLLIINERNLNMLANSKRRRKIALLQRLDL
jgi:hypothetical protein